MFLLNILKQAELEENMSSLQTSLNKAETDFSAGQQRIRYLTSQLKSVEMALGASEGAVKARNEKIESLKVSMINVNMLIDVGVMKYFTVCYSEPCKCIHLRVLIVCVLS